ncbi:hypothetical protein [Microbispora sp. GKU 823]|uniref:DUF7134 domain-containing protein n=1 Tax=Microbispora sp. GKU 823 TaxID=1652100 RepID=UPI0021189E8A|nr:hypothetical protein [Microbispora sp. GKU 823]
MDQLFPPSRWGTAVSGDLLLAAALALVMAAAAALDGPATLSGRVGAVVAAGGLLALAHRRRRPATAVAVVTVVTVTEVVASPQASTAPAFLAIMVATYSLGAYASTWPLVAGLALATAGVATAQYLGPSQGYSRASADTFLVASLVLAPAVVGGVVGARDRLGRRLDAGTERLRAARDERIAEELSRERRRVFDALDVLLRGLDETRRHAAVTGLADVTALERIARDLLTRMRTLVGELRAPSTGDRRPVREVAELRTQVRKALAAANLPETTWSGLRPAGRLALIVPKWRDGVPARVAAPLAWARRHPLTCAVICLAVTLAYTAATASPDPFDGLAPCGVLVVSPFILGVACPIRGALAGLALCLLGCAGLGLAGSAALITAPEATGAVAVIAGCWAAAACCAAAPRRWPRGRGPPSPSRRRPGEARPPRWTNSGPASPGTSTTPQGT